MTDEEREAAIQIEYDSMLAAIFPSEKAEHAERMRELINGRSPEQVARMKQDKRG